MNDKNSYGQERRNNSNLGKSISYLLIGGGIGAVLALLFAPKSGNELRGEISDATRKGYGATLDLAKDLKDQTTVAAQTIKEKADALYDFASKKITSEIDIAGDAIDAAKGVVAEKAMELKGDLEAAGNNAQGRKSSNIF